MLKSGHGCQPVRKPHLNCHLRVFSSIAMCFYIFMKTARARERWSVASHPLWVSVIAVDTAFFPYNSQSFTAPNTFRPALLWILMTTVRSQWWWWWWPSSISRMKLGKVYVPMIFKGSLTTCDFIVRTCVRLTFVSSALRALSLSYCLHKREFQQPSSWYAVTQT